jgi:hypothetical protein
MVAAGYIHEDHDDNRPLDPRSGASPSRPTLEGFALSTHARGLRPLDLRSGASPSQPTLGGFTPCLGALQTNSKEDTHIQYIHKV